VEQRGARIEERADVRAGVRAEPGVGRKRPVFQFNPVVFVLAENRQLNLAIWITKCKAHGVMQVQLTIWCLGGGQWDPATLGQGDLGTWRKCDEEGEHLGTSELVFTLGGVKR